MNPAQFSRRIIAACIAAGVFGGVATALFFDPLRHRARPAKPAIEWIPTPRPIAEFALPATTGELSNETFENRWTLLGFGYLSCPDACPTMLSEMRVLSRTMHKPLQVVFVSVDQARDTLDEISAYLGHFDPGFIGAVGDAPTTTRLARSLGAQYTRPTSDGIIGHSVQYALIGPDGEMQGLLRSGFDPAATARALSNQFEKSELTK